jgi:hypothetical protein
MLHPDFFHSSSRQIPTYSHVRHTRTTASYNRLRVYRLVAGNIPISVIDLADATSLNRQCCIDKLQRLKLHRGVPEI